MIDTLYIILISLNIIFWVYLIVENKAGIAITLNNIFFIFYMVIPGYIQYQNKSYPWLHYSYINDEILTSSIFILITYTIFMILGYLSAKNAYPKKVEREIEYSLLNIYILSILISIPSIYVISKLGIATFFSGRDSAGEQVYNESDSLSMIYAFSKFSIYSLLIALLIIIRNNMKFIKLNESLYIPLLYVTILNFIINNPLSSPRFHYLGMTIGILLVFGYLLKPMYKTILAIASPFFLYFVFPWIKSLGQESKVATNDLLSYLTTGVDYDCMVQLINIYQYVNNGNYSFGSNIMGGIAFFVPRDIWLNKPIHLGALSSEYAGLLYTNLSAPWPGELYYILGYPSLILGAFLSGYAYAKIDFILMNSKNTISYGISVISTGFIFIVLRGAFGAVFPLIFLSISVFFSFMLLIQNGKKYRYI